LALNEDCLVQAKGILTAGKRDRDNSFFFKLSRFVFAPFDFDQAPRSQPFATLDNARVRLKPGIVERWRYEQLERLIMKEYESIHKVSRYRRKDGNEDLGLSLDDGWTCLSFALRRTRSVLLVEPMLTLSTSARHFLCAGLRRF